MPTRKSDSHIDTLKNHNFLVFYSRSKSYIGKRLSNFKKLEEPLKYKGFKFNSIEHAFQASKYLFTNINVHLSYDYFINNKKKVF